MSGEQERTLRIEALDEAEDEMNLVCLRLEKALHHYRRETGRDGARYVKACAAADRLLSRIVALNPQGGRA